MSKDQLNQKLKERIQMFTANCRAIAPEMKFVLKGQSLRDFFKKDKVAGTKQVNRWFSEMKRRIVNLISQKRDGEMFLGVGRILGCNETMVAHSISTFLGSSEGALFIIDTIPGCFIAVHTSPASIAISADVVWMVVPEHNLACNVENPVFGKIYFMHVLPDLTLAIVGKHREGVLCRFLAFHLNTILASYPWTAWNGNQTTWLRKVVRFILEEPPRHTKRDLAEDFNKASTSEPMPQVQEATGWGELYTKWGSVLMKVGPECIKAIGVEELVKKLHLRTHSTVINMRNYMYICA
ncbi:hypothetical protein L7F22_013507 [Adiantum nelumboides]|nr:hypothetical protein [Adiantum nelumboides]